MIEGILAVMAVMAASGGFLALVWGILYLIREIQKEGWTFVWFWLGIITYIVLCFVTNGILLILSVLVTVLVLLGNAVIKKIRKIRGHNKNKWE